MAVNVKMGVDLGGFKSGIQEGQNILKGLNAEMKATEAEFKATGNAEKALEQKTKTLTSQLNVQKAIADQAAAALKKMEEHGVKPTDAAYQKMYVTMMNARAGMNNAQEGLNNLHGQQEKTKKSAEELKDELNGIGKKISLDQVLSGINSITTGLEKAAKKAVQLGEDIWNGIMSSARWADDTATMAQMYGIDVEQFQKMQMLVTNGLDTSVEAILKSQSKLKKGIGSESKDVAEALSEIGVALTETVGNGKYGAVEQARDSLEVFWEAGQKIMALGDEYRQEDMAQKLFGRSWRELSALFEKYKTVKEYKDALEDVQVVSTEAVEAGANLNDKIGELEGKFQTLKNSVLLSMAPALSEVADSLNKVLGSVLDYLQTPEGQELMQSLGDTIGALFEDVKNIDPNSVIEAVRGAFEGIKKALEWINNNSGTVVTALETIVIGWAGLKLTGGVLDIIKLVNGLSGLTGGGAAAAAEKAGEAAGSSWGAAFAGAVMKAAPWLIGLYTLLNPSDTHDELGNNELLDANGNLTNEALAYGFKKDENGEVYQDRRDVVEAAAQAAWDQYRSGKFDQAALESLRNTVLNDNLFADLTDLFYKAATSSENWKEIEDIDLTEWLKGFDTPKVEVAPEVPPGAAEALTSQIGTVPVQVRLEYEGGAGVNMPRKFANGLPFVPYDGYLAMLHRGERVMTASANRSYTYNSNNYFGNVNLNNGHDIDELCTSIDRHNRRMQSGFGA